MDEDQYRSMYRVVNERQCVFEKTINARRGDCSRSRRIHLADRTGVACDSADRYPHCRELLEQLRRNASFALRMAHVDGPLPHANEIRVQAGGLSGLQEVLQARDASAAGMQDIAALLEEAERQFGGIENFPFTEIVKAITRFKGRPRRR